MSSSGDETPIAFEGALGTAEAAALKDKLLAHEGSMALDLSGITSLGALSAQVLLSAKCLVEARGDQFKVSASSDAFTMALRHLGLHHDLITE